MNLDNLILRNWHLWRTGGVDKTMIENSLNREEKSTLSKWGDMERSSTSPITIKTLLDLASWCLYGTHSLYYYPAKYRWATIIFYADLFGMNPEQLIRLITTSVQQLSPSKNLN